MADGSRFRTSPTLRWSVSVSLPSMSTTRNPMTLSKFSKVIKGEEQVVQGTNYNLTITAAYGGAEKNYVALVWDIPWQKFRKLVSFNGPV
ncbi:putative Cystatin domain-containing protein [Helianthus annuus]|nr:putative Cystatin domain-containing protein [Helianthus annuus]